VTGARAQTNDFDTAAYYRSQGLHVLHGVADEQTFTELGPADVIVMLDVIEHLPDPQTILALCHRHLNADGIVVITTGDFSSLHARWVSLCLCVAAVTMEAEG